MKKRYILYIDILGFYPVAKYLEEAIGIKTDFFRKSIIKTIDSKLKTLLEEKLIFRYEKSSDNWLIILNEPQIGKFSLQLFYVLNELLLLNTGFEKYPQIQLEICVGELGSEDGFENKDEIIVIDEVIQFLKTDVVNSFRQKYKATHKSSIKKSFVLFLKEVYQSLEYIDRKNCIDHTFNTKHKTKEYYVVQIDKIKERALIFRFLDRINMHGSSHYDRIDSIFIEPVEFNDIRETLEKRRLVFITGTAEYGKTYSAVRLLWEYYNKGFKPIWFEGEEKIQRTNVRKKLIEIDSIMKENNIIYFEDPFGKTQYEKRESLEREISLIIEKIRNKPNVFVVITSREEVFKHFEKEKISHSDLRKFEEKLNIKKPSYNLQKREEMLTKWAQSFECKWLRNPVTVDLIMKELRNNLLVSPLSIRSFAIATANIIDTEEIRDFVINKSEETSMSFAKEVEAMSIDRIVFLSFLFVTNFNLLLYKKHYDILIESFDFTDKSEFDYLVNWFSEDKIMITKMTVSFSHPSYTESIKYLLVKDGFISNFNKNIFSKILLYLSDQEISANAVAIFVLQNFDNLDLIWRNQIMSKLAENKGSSWILAKLLIEKYSSIGERIANHIIKKLLELEETVLLTIIILHCHRKNLNDSIQKEISIGIMDINHFKLEIAWKIAFNFETQTSRIKNLLLVNLSEKQFANEIATTFLSNFNELGDTLRNELLHSLWNLDKFKVELLEIILDFYLILPEEITDYIYQIPEDSELTLGMVEVFSNNFYNFPRLTQHEILKRLSKEKETTKQIVKNLISNYKLMSSYSKNFLRYLLNQHTLSEKELTEISENVEKIPSNLRKYFT